jgi:hypothetical protein
MAIDQSNDSLSVSLSTSNLGEKKNGVSTKETTLCNLPTKRASESITIGAEGSTKSNFDLSFGSPTSAVSYRHRMATARNENILKASHVIYPPGFD